MQEARAAASLSHPGVTTIYRVGVERDVPYIAMEWLDGESLDTVVSRCPVSIPRVAQLGVALLETLASAHAHGIIHRDIKPANLVVLRSGRLKVADFGVARVAGSKLVQTQAGSLIGTPFYASPEQVRGEEVDARADVYSTGVVLYEPLTGRLPYQAAHILELVAAIIDDREPPPPEAHNPAIPPALSAIVRTAMSKRKSQRFSVATQMAAALRPFTQSRDSTGRVPQVEPARRAERASTTPQATPVTLTGTEPVRMIASLLEQWPQQSLGHQQSAPLVARLLDRPLHAAPFSGAVILDDAVLLIHDAMLYGMFEPDNGRVGDTVYEALPTSADATLVPVPDELPPALVVALDVPGRSNAPPLGVPSVRWRRCSSVAYPDKLHSSTPRQRTDVPPELNPLLLPGTSSIAFIPAAHATRESGLVVRRPGATRDQAVRRGV